MSSDDFFLMGHVFARLRREADYQQGKRRDVRAWWVGRGVFLPDYGQPWYPKTAMDNGMIYWLGNDAVFEWDGRGPIRAIIGIPPSG